MDIFNLYSTDPKLENEGKLFDFGGGVSFLIGRSGNAKYNRMMNLEYEAHKHTLDKKGTDDEIAAGEARSLKIMAYVMAHNVLLGWTGPVEFKGEPLPYSIENAEKLLNVKDFQNEIARRANDFKNYRLAVEEADVKNSSTTSGGNLPGVVA